MCIAAFLPVRDFQYLDHLAPLASLLNVPLVVTDEEMERLAREFYPDLKLLFVSERDYAEELVSRFDLLITCLPKPLLDKLLFFASASCNKKIVSIFVPHGQSDKGTGGLALPYFEGLRDEQALLVYGPRMIRLLQKKEVLGEDSLFTSVGHYRKLYFDRHRHFYQKLLDEKIGCRLKPAPFSLLYAPTWRDHERGSSAPEALEQMLRQLPEGMNLLVQLHPNLHLQMGPRLAALAALYEEDERRLILEPFPAIYPLCSWASHYVGDTSSIGYDFLARGAPLFFLIPPGGPTHLMQAGKTLSRGEYGKIFTQILSSHDDPHGPIRERLYREAFAPLPNWEETKQKILNLCYSLLEQQNVK